MATNMNAQWNRLLHIHITRKYSVYSNRFCRWWLCPLLRSLSGWILQFQWAIAVCASAYIWLCDYQFNWSKSFSAFFHHQIHRLVMEFYTQLNSKMWISYKRFSEMWTHVVVIAVVVMVMVTVAVLWWWIACLCSAYYDSTNVGSIHSNGSHNHMPFYSWMQMYLVTSIDRSLCMFGIFLQNVGNRKTNWSSE